MEAVVWLEDYLSKWNKILFMVSHSQDFLNNVCTNMVNVHKKKLVYYSGNYDTFVQVITQNTLLLSLAYCSEQYDTMCTGQDRARTRTDEKVSSRHEMVGHLTFVLFSFPFSLQVQVGAGSNSAHEGLRGQVWTWYCQKCQASSE